MASILSKKATRNNLITYGLILAAFLILQTLSATGSLSSLFQGLLVPLCIYVILAVSLNLTVGILGELSLGHAGFMCVGAFTGAFFSVVVSETITASWIRFPLALLIGGLSAAVFGLLIGIPILRLRGDYLAIVTLAFGEIIKNLVNVLYIGIDSNGMHFSMKDAMSLNMEPDGKLIINGAMGISDTPQDSNFIVGALLVLLTVAIVLHMIHSRTGRAVMSIRDNRIAAESVGINITKYKLIAFSTSAFLAGIAGVLYAHNLATLTPLQNTFGYNGSIMILVFVVLGGLGSVRGSMIAAIVLYILPELLRGLQNFRMLIYAIVLIIMMIFNSSPVFEGLREKLRLNHLLSGPRVQRLREKLHISRKRNQKGRGAE